MAIIRPTSGAEATGQSACWKVGRRKEGTPLLLGPVLVLCVLAVASLVGCTLSVPLVKPVPSPFQYAERREEPIQVVVKDSRPAEEKKLSKGRISVELVGATEDLSFLVRPW